MKRTGAIVRMSGAVCAAVALLTTSACSDPAGPAPPGLTVGWRTEQPLDLHLRVVVGTRDRILTEPGDTELELREGYHAIALELREVTGTWRSEIGWAEWFGSGVDYWIRVQVGGDRPFGTCVGEVRTMGEVAGDSVFVLSGGLPRGSIC